MLTRLVIKNYVLIRELDINFSDGLSIITGETGAGKSILLGAMGLVLGERADAKTLFDKNNKCIIEAEFSISHYNLKDFFSQHDIDFENDTIIRREINAEGKSRAFVNDTPVNLSVLKELSSFLVDVHSQHQTLTLNTSAFQLNVLDITAGNQKQLNDYNNLFNEYKKLLKQVAELKALENKSIAESEFLQFQFDELEAAGLKSGEFEKIESELQILNNTENIVLTLDSTSDILSEGETNVLSNITQAVNRLNGIARLHPSLTDILKRIQSCNIELKDISSELTALKSQFSLNPSQLEILNDRLSVYNKLLQKHRVKNADDLIVLQQGIASQLQSFQSLADEIEKCEKQTQEIYHSLRLIAEELHNKRQKAAQSFKKDILKLLKEVSLNDAQFDIDLTTTEELTTAGTTAVRFLFSANKGVTVMELAKVASGGELSRLMLCIKALIANKTSMPTIIFDEIDTGISGEVAHKVGNLIEQLSKSRQVLAITHLPQMAGKGKTHYFVFKHIEKGIAQSRIKTLTPDERVVEIAKMLSGEEVTDASLQNARHLLIKS
ncbi:MAG: DNA repair protein RecN [Bacteroidetes bacterium]|jgi:DNA repair protein RecN (Recombination protein N)|nr:DNA repair protein RecN [Bacteroidota bacterium]MBX7239915.1 DNA repair protein RecN [Bacteroidia bacterium]MCW5919446.1 DNA repair protein RecN [Bacteroidota bacterium]HMU77955.1 DNA repair protein RecN [Bacteroidia bacterium]HMW10508.1 DNA repair protein RecN [Bacteroidia bacterium]